MNEASHLSDDEKWQAVVSCNKSHDGIFFYGVKTTKIFCRPSCRSKTPAPANVVFFANAESALELGFRPCKRCRPDQQVFDPDLDIIKKVMLSFQSNFDQTIEFQEIAKGLGISSNHLRRLFKKHYGMTPIHYINQLRINKAAELLAHKNDAILDIAYATGFKSLSAFYECFKEQIGMPPNEYRRAIRHPNCNEK